MQHPWIFLRGLTRESAHWGDFADLFEAALPGAQVLALDLPGNGSLHGVRSPATVAGLVAACRGALAGRGMAPPFHLLALSLGGMVAVEWARMAPSEVAGCVLINTSFRPFSPFYRRLRPHNYGALARLVLPSADAESAERAILALTSRRAVDLAGVVAPWAAARRARPVSAANALRQLIAAARYRAPARAPVPRTLVLASRHDALVNVQCSEALARAWGAELAIHPAAGHDLPLDDGPWVIGQIARWLAAGAPHVPGPPAPR